MSELCAIIDPERLGIVQLQVYRAVYIFYVNVDCLTVLMRIEEPDLIADV
jgi:hypothetical protein